jgi:hypothetical protein
MTVYRGTGWNRGLAASRVDVQVLVLGINEDDGDRCTDRSRTDSWTSCRFRWQSQAALTSGMFFGVGSSSQQKP